MGVHDHKAVAGSRPRRDFPALTGLRAVAATWVVLFHLIPFAGLYVDQVPGLRALATAGWTGVELFFVLSGFVITLSYAEKVGARPTPAVVGRFWINRVARVWPAWAVVTVLMGAWLFLIRSRGWNSEVVTNHPDVSLLELVRQLAMVHEWGRSGTVGLSWVLPGWSISAEWTAYLVFPLVAVLVRPVRRLPAVVLLGLGVLVMTPLSVVAVAHGDPEAVPWTVRIACGFLAGVLTALAVRRVREGDRADSAGLTMTWASIVLVVCGAFWSAWTNGQVPGDHSGVVVLLYPVLVAGLALTQRGPSRWLACAPLVYGGKISYCLYLTHFVVLDVVLTTWWRNTAPERVFTPGVNLVMPIIVLAAFLSAAVLHHAVEEPARKLITRLTDRGVPGRRAQVEHPAPSLVLAPTPRQDDEPSSRRVAASAAPERFRRAELPTRALAAVAAPGRPPVPRSPMAGDRPMRPVTRTVSGVS